MKKLIWQLGRILRSNITLFLDLQALKLQKFQTFFPHEQVTIALPPLRTLSSFRRRKKVRARSIVALGNYSRHEILLRLTVAWLYEERIIDKRLSIIDIGSWIGDNALPWAKWFEPPGVVFAIDPSELNGSLVREVAALNDIDNIITIPAICSDKSGSTVGSEDSLEHATFHENFTGTGPLWATTTIDNLVAETSGDKIGLFHIDVEGFELRVLRGSEEVLNRSGPVVIFEQHLSSEDPREVIMFLEERGYQIFMINEVIPGNSPDCRNFIAFKEGTKMPTLDQDFSAESADSIWKATPGASLIRVG